MLTNDQKKKLYQAIDNAQGFGECSYAKGCVIAQLAELEGADPSDWDEYKSRSSHGALPIHYLWEECESARISLKTYPLYLLSKIQEHWDRGQNTSVSEAKEAMRCLVDNA
jgi:hypothetical protein